MKKIIAISLVLVFALFAFASCGAKEADYTLGIGTAVTDTKAKLKVSFTSAAVVMDSEGKVVLCRIDAADATATLDDDGVVETAKVDKTKAEMGDAYNMVAYGGAKSEWYKQARFFEDYVVGKTQAEIEAIKTGDADLVAGCTIDVADFVVAVTNAMKSDKKVSFKAPETMTAGVAINARMTDKKGNAQYLSDCSAVVKVDDKVVAAIIDSCEATVELNDSGAGVGFTYAGTKLEQGDNYGMVAYGGATAEWYAQAQAFANTAVGKTYEEVNGLATEGVAGCTIDVGTYHVALVYATRYAR